MAVYLQNSAFMLTSPIGMTYFEKSSNFAKKMAKNEEKNLSARPGFEPLNSKIRMP